MLMQQRNALIAEIQNLKEQHELETNSLQVSHEMALHSINEQFESKLLAANTLQDTHQQTLRDGKNNAS